MSRITSQSFRVLFLASFVALSGICDAQTLPDGWRLPTASELSDSWRDHQPERFAAASGDFSGDGIPDRAMLLISDDDSRVAPFIHLSNGPKRYSWIKIEETAYSAIHSKGLDRIPPGRYRTACGKGYWRCGANEPRTIQSSHDLLHYFKYESSGEYIVFEMNSDKFRKVWISD